MQEKGTSLKRMAQVGLIAKGFIYCLLGIFAFMAAFHLGNSTAQSADKQSVITWIVGLTGGNILLGLLIFGLLCYTLWRFIQAFANIEHKGHNAKGWGYRVMYFFSGLIYGGLALSALRLLLKNQDKSGGNKNEQMASSILDQPFGQWLLGAIALGMIGAGLYQIWYGFSEKYTKHVNEVNARQSSAGFLIKAGKAGYMARGVVWFIIAWLLFKAAIHARAEEAATGTGEAFRFLENAAFGSYIIGAIGAGLVCYGIFSFIRAKYESLNY